MRDQRRAIETLEAEKASLTTQVDNLSQVENSTLCRLSSVLPFIAETGARAESRHTLELFQAERAKTEELDKTIRELRSQTEKLSQKVNQQQESLSSLKAEKESLDASAAELNAALASRWRGFTHIVCC